MRHDRDRPGGDLDRAHRFAFDREVQRGRAIDDMHQLLAVWMALPGAKARELAGE